MLLTPYTVLEAFENQYVGISGYHADLSQPFQPPPDMEIAVPWRRFLLSTSAEAYQLYKNTFLRRLDDGSLEEYAWDSSLWIATMRRVLLTTIWMRMIRTVHQVRDEILLMFYS
jgi:hypothetical protein